METFRLVFQGERVGRFAELTLEKHLSVLPFSDSAKQKLLSGSSVVLKEKLDSKGADHYQEKFQNLGLQTELQLQLSPSCFNKGLKLEDSGTLMSPISVSKRVGPTEAIDDTPAITGQVQTRQPPEVIYTVDRQLIKPTIASKPQDYSIFGQNDRLAIIASSANFRFNPLFLLALSTLLGLTLQTYFLHIMLHYFEWHTAASVLSVIALLAVVTIFPKMMQPLNRVDLTHSDSKRVLSLHDAQTIMIGQRVASWVDKQSQQEGFIVRANSAAELHDSKGLKYTWKASHRLDAASASAHENLQNALIDDTPLGTFMTVVDYVGKIGGYYSKNVKAAEIDWSAQAASVVSNSDGRICALIYQDPVPAFRLVSDQLDEASELELSALCISILGPSLV